MKRLLLALTATLLGLPFAASALAQSAVPLQLSYQSKITAAAGALLGSPAPAPTDPATPGKLSHIVPHDPDNTPAVLSTQPQFAADYANTGGSGPIGNSATLSARFPSQIYVNPGTGVPTGIALVQHRSTFGQRLRPRRAPLSPR